jgi:hypothetical protein
VPFLHYARDTVIRDQARTLLYKEPRKDTFGKRHWAQLECNNSIRNWGLKSNYNTFRKWEDIWWDFREGFRAGVYEVKSQTFSQDLENECQDIVEWSAPSET